MRIACIGGGPAGLYSAILLKKADPSRAVTVFERHRADDTFGFGVVFSDATLGNLAAADPPSYAAIAERFAHWDDIETHIGGRVFRSTGHGFCGLARLELLTILQRRARELGVELVFERQVTLAELSHLDLVIAADGVSSRIRDELGTAVGAHVDWRPNKFVWLGTTVPFEAFTFYFERSAAGLFRVHAYRYAEDGSTFIVECTEETWRRAGLDRSDEDGTIAYLEGVFASQLGEHRLHKNRSIWRSFPTVRLDRWHVDNVVLVGDAAHTAHFSIGSGTKLAMEDGIALTAALQQHREVPRGLAAYEQQRRPQVEKLQRAAEVSLDWFENTERYLELAPIQFAYSLLTRSLRVTHENLRRRDPALVAEVESWFSGHELAPPPPMFVPLALRGCQLANRVVLAPQPLEAAQEGVVGALHQVQLGAVALGGVGLLVSESCAVRATARASAGAAGLWGDSHVAAWSAVRESLAACAPTTAVCALLGHRPVELSAGDLSDVRSAFTAAVRRAVQSGFDAVMFDAAPNTLLGHLLSPRRSQRGDGYGGDAAGRMRLLIELCAAARELHEQPLGVRLCADEGAADGITPEYAVDVAGRLREVGCDFVSVVTALPHAQRLYQVPHADRLRNEAKVVTIAEGAIDSFDDVNSVLAAGRADLCALDAALAFDPFFVRRAAAAQGYPLLWPQGYGNAQGYRPR